MKQLKTLKENRIVKRSTSGGPINLYVETLLVTDCSVYADHQIFANSTDQNVVFSHMKIYFGHLFLEVRCLKWIK